MRDETIEGDVKMMETPSDWPRSPFLPLKKRDGYDFRNDGHLAVLTDDLGEDRYVVLVGANLFKPESFAKAERRRYESAEEVAKEWKVD